MYSILRYSILKSTVVQYNSWHTGASMEWTDKKSYCLEEGDKAGCGRAEGLSAAGDGGQAAISVTSDVIGYVKVWRYILISESSQLQGSYVGDLLYSMVFLHVFRVDISDEAIARNELKSDLILPNYCLCNGLTVCVCVCVCVYLQTLYEAFYTAWWAELRSLLTVGYLSLSS